MAVPATTARGTPTGIALQNGFRTTLSFARAPTVSLWEQSMGGLSFDGGDPNDMSHMLLTQFKIKSPRALIDTPPFQMKCFYDPAVYSTLKTTLIQQPGSITQWLPDGSNIDFYGYINKAEIAGDFQNGEPPMLNVSIVITNWDPVNKVEQGPVITSVAGT